MILVLSSPDMEDYPNMFKGNKMENRRVDAIWSNTRIGQFNVQHIRSKVVRSMFDPRLGLGV